MHIQALQLARVAFEARLKTGKSEARQIGLIALYSRCWNCYEELQAQEKDDACVSVSRVGGSRCGRGIKNARRTGIFEDRANGKKSLRGQSTKTRIGNIRDFD